MKTDQKRINELTLSAIEGVMHTHDMEEYRNEALKSEFAFYGIMSVPDVFNENFERKEIDVNLVEYFLISDHYEHYIPWPILISDLKVTMPFYYGPYDSDTWEAAFSFIGNKPVYLTHNLWTCDCTDSQYIWDIDTICCPKCLCVEDEESMDILKNELDFLNWKTKSKRIPYLYERFEYPLKQYIFDETTMIPLMHEVCKTHHGAPITVN